MLWRVTLAVAVVCVGSICNGVKADVMSRLVVPRDYGVKLCGREFIRAVIFTCGGSRWRRATEGDLEPFKLDSLTDDTVDNNQHNWQRGSELTDARFSLRSAFSLADLLALYADERQRQSLPGQDPMDKKPSTALGEQGSRVTADWPISSKKKRNFSLGVAGMCCSQGCTKNDIGRLC